MATTPRTTPRATRGAAVLLPLVVVAIALGILGMHALQQHGAMPGGSHDMSSMTPAAVADELVPDEVAAAPSDPIGHGPGSMVMTCVFMLAAAGLALLALGVRRGVRTVQRLVAVPRGTPPATVARLGTGPPPVWAFSVIRC